MFNERCNKRHYKEYNHWNLLECSMKDVTKDTSKNCFSMLIHLYCKLYKTLIKTRFVIKHLVSSNITKAYVNVSLHKLNKIRHQ